MLDFLPNAVHAGIYHALAAGYYDEQNLDLRIVTPTSTADTLRLIDAGKADIGLADSVDVFGQIDRGRDAQAILAITQRPLGGVITRRADGIVDPADLAGRRVGISGVPSDEVILDTILRDAGTDPQRVERVTIGFNGVRALQNGSVAGFVGYYPADATQARVSGTPTRVFAFDEHGGPRAPGLVAFSTRSRIAREPGVMRAFAEATTRGYQEVLASPPTGLAHLLAENRALRRPITAAQLRAYLPLFQADAPAFGVLPERRIASLSAFLARSGLTGRAAAPGRSATARFAPQP